MQIRVATGLDLEVVLGMAVAFYAEDGFTTPEGLLRQHLDVLLTSPDAHVCAASLGGEAVAFAITTTSFGLENGLVAELEDLYVRPEARRQGLADGLITDAAAWARDRGCGSLEVVVAPNGRDVGHLHRFYLQREFRDEGRRLLSRGLR